MKIGYSEPTLLAGIIKQAQDIASEARWLEYYSHCAVSDTTVGCLEDCVRNIEDSLVAIKENIEHLKGEAL